MTLAGVQVARDRKSHHPCAAHLMWAAQASSSRRRAVTSGVSLPPALPDQPRPPQRATHVNVRPPQDATHVGVRSSTPRSPPSGRS